MRGIMWIEIFKAGRHTDSSGRTHEFTAEALDRIAGLYNTKLEESESFAAPVVKGHPKSDEPAYGWVGMLARRGNRLMARLKDLAPEFVGQVRQGLFKKISIALYPDMMLRHVGFLGAAAPAVKGLRNVTFSDKEELLVFEAETQFSKAAPAKPPRTLTRIQELEQENQKLRLRISEMEKETRMKGFREFAESLVDRPEGPVITPAQAEDLIGIMEMAHRLDAARQDKYSEEDSALAKVKSFVSALKPMPMLGNEIRAAIPDSDEEEKFSEKAVLPERMELHRRAKEIMAERKSLEYEEAVAKALREQCVTKI